MPKTNDSKIIGILLLGMALLAAVLGFGFGIDAAGAQDAGIGSRTTTFGWVCFGIAGVAGLLGFLLVWFGSRK